MVAAVAAAVQVWSFLLVGQRAAVGGREPIICEKGDSQRVEQTAAALRREADRETVRLGWAYKVWMMSRLRGPCSMQLLRAVWRFSGGKGTVGGARM